MVWGFSPRCLPARRPPLSSFIELSIKSSFVSKRASVVGSLCSEDSPRLLATSVAGACLCGLTVLLRLLRSMLCFSRLARWLNHDVSPPSPHLSLRRSPYALPPPRFARPSFSRPAAPFARAPPRPLVTVVCQKTPRDFKSK